MMISEQQARTPRFWRDPALPFVETREALDGRLLCYAKHAHACFSIGTITRGRSTYFNEKTREQVGAGTLVLMNPGDVHACNPIDGQLWSYRMFYIDSEWLGHLQHQLGLSHNPVLQPFSAILSHDPVLFRGLNQLHELLNAAPVDHLRKECALIDYFSTLQQRLVHAPTSLREDKPRLRVAAEFIRAHCTQALTLEAICSAAELSPCT